MIEIFRVTKAMRIEGRVGPDEFTFFRNHDHWVFYVSDPSTVTDEYHFALSARFPARLPMHKPLAIKIAWACAKHYEKHFHD